MGDGADWARDIEEERDYLTDHDESDEELADRYPEWSGRLSTRIMGEDDE